MKLLAAPDPASDTGMAIPVPDVLRQYVIPVDTGMHTCLQYDFGYILHQQIPLGVHSIDRFFVVSDRQVPVYAYHHSPLIGILYNIKGSYSCRLQHDEQLINTKAGDYGPYYTAAGANQVLVPAGISGALHILLQPDPLVTSMAAFSPAIQSLLHQLHTEAPGGQAVALLRMNSRTKESINRIPLYEAHIQPAEIYYQGILYNLITELARQLHQYAQQSREEEKPREKVRKVHDFIVSQPNLRTCTMDHLSEIAGLSGANLRKLFKQAYHQPIQHFVRQQCLQKAASMLLEFATMRIEDIAFEVGYANQSNLSNAFKAAYGMYPRDYRKTM
jgi:AraC-like DNA-binding protein